MVDLILKLKNKCNFGREIGESLSLKEQEITFLSAISEDAGISSKRLCALAGLSPSRGSRVVSALSEKGLVSIRHNEDDRRITCLSLTEEGEQCVSRLKKEKDRCEQEILSNLSEEEKETIITGLNILLGKLQENG